jgi:hypothetical protein
MSDVLDLSNFVSDKSVIEYWNDLSIGSFVLDEEKIVICGNAPLVKNDEEILLEGVNNDQ